MKGTDVSGCLSPEVLPTSFLMHCFNVFVLSQFVAIRGLAGAKALAASPAYWAAWMLNVSTNILHFRFDFVGGQNTKIHSKYQNSFQAQNAKISAVSTPILTAKAAFFSIFHALSEKSVENA